MSTKPIGVFDSGVGGLSVLKELVKTLPNENYIYFGDTARVPYGEKSPTELIGFSREILDWFKSQDVKMVLMACNTSSAVTLKIVQDEYDFPIIGLIDPTADYIKTLDSKNIGLMATTATVNSKSYSKAIEKYGKTVVDVACPGLVEIVENGLIEAPESIKKITEYLHPLLEKNVDKIILGCTHYPFLKGVMEQIGCNSNMFIDSAVCITLKAKETMEKISQINTKEGSIQFFVSSNPMKFEKNSALFFDSCKNTKLLEFIR